MIINHGHILMMCPEKTNFFEAFEMCERISKQHNCAVYLDLFEEMWIIWKHINDDKNFNNKI